MWEYSHLGRYGGLSASMVRRYDPKRAGNNVGLGLSQWVADTLIKSGLETTYFISLQRISETAITPQATVVATDVGAIHSRHNQPRSKQVSQLVKSRFVISSE